MAGSSATPLSTLGTNNLSSQFITSILMADVSAQALDASNSCVATWKPASAHPSNQNRNSHQNPYGTSQSTSKQGNASPLVDSTPMSFAESPIVTILCLPADQQTHFLPHDCSEYGIPTEGGSVTPSRQFKVHKDIVVTKSAYFKACFSLGGIESNSSTVTLNTDPTDGHDAAAIAVIVKWMYRGKVALSDIASRHTKLIKRLGSSSTRVTSETTQALDMAQRSLTSIYIQADKFSMDSLQNDVLDVIRPLSTHTFGSVRAWMHVREAVSRKTKLDKWFSAAMKYWINQPRFVLTYSDKKLLERKGSLAVKILAMKCEKGAGRLTNPVRKRDEEFHDNVEGKAAKC